MNANELEQILESGLELPNVDFKSPISWSAKYYVKHFLAMSNTAGGGYIVVGVNENEDGSYERVGVNEEIAATYKADDMKDQISPYADPFIKFDVYKVEDTKGLQYVVVKIFEFEDVPVLCRKALPEKKIIESGIYFRSQDGKPSSQLVKNYFDMRDILERAMYKMRSKFDDQIKSATPSVDDQFDEEVKDII